jgi:aryl-alcohol dehydrogenase-like predicted oxidoreductase
MSVHDIIEAGKQNCPIAAWAVIAKGFISGKLRNSGQSRRKLYVHQAF